MARRMSVLMTSHIHPELMTCEDVAATGRYPYTGRLGILSREDREKVAQCLALVHASDLAERDFSRISDGQRPMTNTLGSPRTGSSSREPNRAL